MSNRMRTALIAAALSLVSWQASASSIHVATATYGTPAVSTCDATPAVAAQCDGHKSCAVDVRNMKLCGDPDFLEVKSISISYLCGNRLYKTSAPEYRVSELACR